MGKRMFWVGLVSGAMLATVVVVVVGLTGVIPMAADRGTGLLDWAGDVMWQRSVDWRAPTTKNPLAGNAKATEDGLRDFGRMCVQCHGAPGAKREPFADHMLPRPPDLADHDTQKMPDGDLFHIIDHGVRMTGMPAFGKVEKSDDDIWKLVAAVRQLASLTPDQRHALDSAQLAADPPH